MIISVKIPLLFAYKNNWFQNTELWNKNVIINYIFMF